MRPKDTRTGAELKVPSRATWGTPRLSRLAATEAELFLAGGPDAELTS